MKMRSVGIDLGTTNSCVATIDANGKAAILSNAKGRATTPSMVSADDGNDERYVVGEAARARAVMHPETTIFGAKRLLGRRFDDPDVVTLRGILPYPVMEAPNGDAWIVLDGEPLSPVQVSAMILRELSRTATRHFGDPADEVIVTVPAYFDNQQRQATKDAAEIAGLRVRRLLNEPTAAALGYGAHRGADRRFAVCDLGGGTFDVSIVNVESGVFEVISTHGDPFLGGDDFDHAIIEALAQDIRDAHHIDVVRDPQAVQRLKEQAKLVKHGLSEAKTIDIHLPHLAQTKAGISISYQRTVTRAELERWTEMVVDRLVSPCREASARCGLQAQDIDAVILVGGMTRMPAVQRKIAAIFGRQPLKVVNPDEIVAIGAATECAILDGVIDDVVLLDVTSRGLGLSVDAGPVTQIIPRNATIPTRGQHILVTSLAGQRQLTFDICEGESSALAGNRHLARFEVFDLPDAAAGELAIIVDITVDVDGLLHAAASEVTTRRALPLRLLATSGLSRASVARFARRFSP